MAAPSAAVDRRAPRIVGAQMVDADLDGKADRIRLTYSERIRHALDKSRFPFTVVGYKVKRVSKARGKTLVVLLAEQAVPDPLAAPAVKYKRTKKQPVRDRAGNQARRQTFRGTKPFGAPGAAACIPTGPDEPDLAFVDSNCDGIDGTEANAIFVSPIGSDANPGTRAQPKRTMAVAVSTAAAAAAARSASTSWIRPARS